MYTVYANGQYLHNMNLSEDGFVVYNATVNDKLNTQGSFSFTVAKTNPLYAEIKRRKTYITIHDDFGDFWRGRVIDTQLSFDGQKKVTCEGELAYFLDSIRRPFIFHGTPAQLLNDIIYSHNQQVGLDRQFSVGTVTVTAPTADGTFDIDSRNAQSSWKLMQNELIKRFGGYIVTRKSSGTVYVDYLADFSGFDCQQTVEFGKNMLDLTESIDAADVITYLIPYGARLSSDDPAYVDPPPSSGSWDANRLTVRSVNSGSDVIYSQTGSALWGAVYGSKTFDDITDATKLKTEAETWLAESIAEKISIQVKAFDLSLIDLDVEKIGVGTYVWAICDELNLKLKLLCNQKTLNLNDPSKTSVILGAGKQTISDIQGGMMYVR